MKIKAGEIYDAFLVLTAIINEKRDLPQKGKYRVARMHAALKPEAEVIAEQRNTIIKSMCEEQVDENGQPKWQVPPERMAEFREAWDKIASDEIEVNCQPIPLESLGEVGSIEAHEYLTLGSLVTE